MPYSIECYLEIHINMAAVLWVLKVPLTQYCQVENLLSCTASWSKACLLLSYDLFCLRLQLSTPPLFPGLNDFTAASTSS